MGERVSIAKSISIHVLRVEDDGALQRPSSPQSDFNPRPPCGGRQQLLHFCFRVALFQSTSSVWRTT